MYTYAALATALLALTAIVKVASTKVHHMPHSTGARS
jgi:hypothetical protein